MADASATGIQLGTAWLQISISAKGIQSQLSQAVGGPTATKLGASVGQRLARSIGTSIAKTPSIARALAASVRSGAESLQILGMYAKDAAAATARELSPIGRALQSVARTITGPVVRAWQGLSSAASSAWASAGQAVSRMTAPITSALSRAGQTVSGWASSIGARVSSTMATATAPIVSLGQRVGGAFQTASATVTRHVSPIASKVSQTMGQAASAVGAAASRIGQAWAPVGQMIGSGLTSAVGRAASGMGSVLSSAGAGVVSVAGRIGSAIGNALSSTVKFGVQTAGLAVAGLTAVITSNLGGAIQRADQLNNFPKVMANIGFSADEAREQIDRISDSLDGLPVTTDAVARTAQGLAPLTGSLTEATDISLALSDALLAGGASGAVAENAMEQYRQMLSTGTVDMAAWRSMQSAMPGQLDQMAKALLGAEASSNDLYDAMKDGTVSFDDFNRTLVQLDSEGIDGLASFHDQAIAATGGIGTAFTNAGSRIKKALASIIEAIGVDEIAGKINQLTSGIVGLGDKIASVIEGLKGSGKAEDALGPLAGLAPIIGSAVGALGPLLSQIPLLGGAFSGLTGPVGLVIGLFTSMWSQSDSLRSAVSEAFSGIGEAMKGLGPIVQVLSQAFGQIALMLGNSLGTAIRAIMPSLLSLAQSLFPAIQQVLTAVMPVFQSLVALVAGTVVQVISILVPIIADLAQTLLPVIVQVIQSLMPPIQQVISAIIPAVQQILPTLGSVLRTITQVLGNIIKAVLPPLAKVLGTVISVFASLIKVITAAAVPAFNVISSVVKTVVNAMGTAFNWLWTNIFSPVFTKINGVLTTFKNFLETTVLPKVKSVASSMGTAFDNFKKVAEKAFNAVKSVAAKPINFVINTVYRDGIKKAFDTIASKIGLSLRMPTVNAIPGYARGGVLPGYTPGRDVYHFRSHDGGGELALSGGEAIMVPEWTKAVGGPRAVAAMNAAARGGRALPLGDRGSVPGFFLGGIWEKTKNAVGGGIQGVTDWISSAADAVGEIIADPLGAIAELVTKPVNALIEKIPGGGMWRDIAVAAPRKILGGIGSFFKKKVDESGISGSDLVTQARKAIGTPYVWGGSNVPGGVDCSGLIVWALRALGKQVPRHTASSFQAASTPGNRNVPGNLLFWGGQIGKGGAYHVAVASGGGRMVEAPRAGLNVVERAIWGNPSAGIFKYDRGGLLQPGLSLVANETGRPEPVFTGGQWDRIAELVTDRDRWPDKMTLVDANGSILGQMDVRIERAVGPASRGRLREALGV